MSETKKKMYFPSQGIVVTKEQFEQIKNTQLVDEQKEEKRLKELEEEYKKRKILNSL